MPTIRTLTATPLLALTVFSAQAGEVSSVALKGNKVGTLHVMATVGAHVRTEFLLDTGSAYVVLTEATRHALADEGALTPVRKLRAVMANDATARAQVYRVSSLTLGAQCTIRNFEAVALPGARKDILGLSVLRVVAPFTVGFEPLRLQISCGGETGDASVVALSDGAAARLP